MVGDCSAAAQFNSYLLAYIYICTLHACTILYIDRYLHTCAAEPERSHGEKIPHFRCFLLRFFVFSFPFFFFFFSFSFLFFPVLKTL